MFKNLKSIYFFSIIFLVVDQLIKIFISSKMFLGQSFILIKNLLSINLVHNTGAAFSILDGSKILLILIGVIAFIGISYYISKIEYLNDSDVFIYSLLIGGVLGNLVDRIVHGYVIDYISFKFGNYLFPVFNFADICIVVSIILIIANTIKEDLWKS